MADWKNHLEEIIMFQFSNFLCMRRWHVFTSTSSLIQKSIEVER
jgi:hypothetical protein